MIPVSRKGLCLVQTLAILILAALPFTGSEPLVSNLAVAIPVAFLAEIILYFVLALVFNPRMQLTTAAGVAVGGFTLRLLACTVAFLIYNILFAGDADAASGNLLATAFGQPFVVLIQVIFVLLGMANLVSVVAPGLISDDTLISLGAGGQASAAPLPTAPGAGPSHLSEPKGQFIQVFSYEELGATIRKTPGLEGFVVYNNEGLVVWRDLPIRLDVDALVSRLASGQARLGASMQDAGLGDMNRVMIESAQHAVYSGRLNDNFGLLVVGKPEAANPELHGRIPVVTSTVSEFLRWRYPSLPVRTPSVREIAV